MKEPKAKVPPRAALTLVFTIIVFSILVITMILVGGVVYLLNQIGVLGEISKSGMPLPILIFSLTSIVTGTIIATIISGIPLKPVHRLITGLNRLAAGDYGARLDLGPHPVTRDLSESFNLLADELQNTEMLRSDFVNNFSHEFKTPIVSIRGFAKLLQKEKLSDRQQEYLGIIVEESTRLSEMATNILNLTKVENQSILTEVTRFNLSEQVRDCILLLENKWSQKNLRMLADFDEYEIHANEELLKQVWINILDNSIKFSPEHGEVGISISQASGVLTVSIKNSGLEISAKDQKHIFNKYWQGDTSHSSEGTGVGLSIARRITELHKGSISVMSASGETIFSVALPQ